MPIKGNKIFFEFDPLEGKDLSPGDKADALSAIADFVKEQVLLYVGDGESPVSGGKWKRSLSPDYLKQKKKESGVNFANLELTGALLDSLDVVRVGDKLSLQILGDEAPKADGHNNHSGKSSLPERRFIPDEGQKFKKDIMAGIKDIIESYESEPQQESRGAQSERNTSKKTVKKVDSNGRTFSISLEDFLDEL